MEALRSLQEVHYEQWQKHPNLHALPATAADSRETRNEGHRLVERVVNGARF